ncbi:asparagine--tRNA ligase [Gehongia tenuis]|uniref:Asparagine--tRNA ligase n=1 Tax=Gehongia tenuis TaxID=2763655 RepID=A0A926D8D2_9FIRM|nr:asparagine--tRNA ligase [Gehongia tenuis]MBC8532275.1 asparagine--tRNA ligase [Gehongia tenuis]
MSIELRSLHKDPAACEGQTVSVNGWVRTVRDSKVFAFIELADGTAFRPVQLVLDKNETEDFDRWVKLKLGSAITATGRVVLTPEAKQPYEIKVERIELVGDCDAAYPLQKKRHTPEYLRTIAHLRPRTNLFQAVFRIRSLAAYALHRFFQERGFIYVQTPLITASDCEGAGEMFQVTTLDLKNVPMDKGEVDFGKDFFGKPANLTVSGQLNAESFCLAFKNVYTFGPTFRAENSNTPRHAAEFWMLEPEIAFADLSDNMDLAEDMTKYVLTYLLEHARDDLTFLNQFVDKGLIQRVEALAGSEFVRITYTEAIERLQKSGASFQFPTAWGEELQTEHERYLTEKIFHGPVFVTDYPKDVKAFYMRVNDDGKTVAAMDMLVPGVGELIGGSQREERLDVLLARMKEMGLEEAPYWWYLDLRKYGGTPHAGFGIGFDRLVMYVTGVTNIRDVLPFPRTAKSAEF